MRHLSRERLLEAVEAEASPDTAVHLAGCGRCRSEVEALRRTLEDVRAVDVLEPSPLFWDHLALRVREAIAVEPDRDTVSRSLRTWWRPAMAAAIVLLAAVLVDRGVRHARRAPAAMPVVAVDRPSAAPPPAAPLTLDAGDDWQFIVELATASAGHQQEPHADADLDARIGSAELGVSELSADERRELVKLLNDALAEAAPRARPAKGDV